MKFKWDGLDLIAVFIIGFVFGFLFCYSFSSPSSEAPLPSCESKMGGFFTSKETATIKAAAKRNGCYGDNYLLLFAIRKAENGRAGCEFGVKGAAWDTDLNTQAGWSAATIVKTRARWNKTFIDFLGDRYCPKEVDLEGNINFKKNVRFWFERFRK